MTYSESRNTLFRIMLLLPGREIEEMPPGLVLGLDNPGIRIEADFPGQALLHRSFGLRLFRNRHEEALDRPAVVINRLRRRHVQHRIAVERGHLDEDGARLLRPAPAHRAEHALALAAAQIGRNPNTGLQSHV